MGINVRNNYAVNCDEDLSYPPNGPNLSILTMGVRAASTKPYHLRFAADSLPSHRVNELRILLGQGSNFTPSSNSCIVRVR